MDCFIKKIFEGKAEGDELVHNQFQKFSKGEFKNKAMIIAKKSKDKFRVNTTPEYTNEFVRMLAEKLGDKNTHIKGPIISTRNLKEMPEFSDLLAHVQVKQFMGIKQFILDQELTGNQIIQIMEATPLSHFGFSFETEDTQLKIKPKAPKSAKPSTKGEAKPKVDFCKLITTNKELVKNLLFDIDLNTLKKVEISHDFIITDLELPKDEKDFAAMREKAKRIGKIIRKITIEEKTQEKEADLRA